MISPSATDRARSELEALIMKLDEFRGLVQDLVKVCDMVQRGAGDDSLYLLGWVVPLEVDPHVARTCRGREDRPRPLPPCWRSIGTKPPNGPHQRRARMGGMIGICTWTNSQTSASQTWSGFTRLNLTAAS
jgi:hypothetical protein